MTRKPPPSKKHAKSTVACCFFTLFIGLYASAVYLFVGTGKRYRHVHGVSSVVLSRGSKNNVKQASPKTTMYVVSLQGVKGADKENEGRMDRFRREWARDCHGLDSIEFKQCPGEIDDRRGFGLTRAYITCFGEAMSDKSSENFAVFLEDDARLFFPGFCNQTFREELWDSAPENTFVLMLGGHSWQFPDEEQQPPQVPTAQVRRYSYIHANFSYGTYGFAVRRDSLNALQAGYEWDIFHPPGVDYRGVDRVSPDIALYEHGQRHGKNVYAADPLIIQHIAGYSNTWHANRDKVLGNNFLPPSSDSEDEDDDSKDKSLDQEEEIG